MTAEHLRICLVSKQFPPDAGGAETYAYELANGLGKRGHTVDVYTQATADEETVSVHENVTVHRIAKARRKLVTVETLWFSLRARREIDVEAYDVIHGTLMPASTIAVTPFRDIDTPVVLTSHGTSLGETTSVALETPADYLLKFCFHPMNVVMDAVAGRGADEIIAISDHAHRQLVERYGFDPEHVHTIPHGVDTDRFYPRSEPHPAVDPDKQTLLYVGRLGARKGLDLALEALARIEEPAVEFLIAGTGRHEATLRKRASELGVSEQVRFLGYVPEEELPSLYSSADVFVLPSRYEGFGLVVLEAMACGTPVVGVSAGGIPTAIDHGSNGTVVDRDADALSEAISAVISTGYTNEEPETTARDGTMNWSRVCEAVEGVYSSTLSDSP